MKSYIESLDQKVPVFTFKGDPCVLSTDLDHLAARSGYSRFSEAIGDLSDCSKGAAKKDGIYLVVNTKKLQSTGDFLPSVKGLAGILFLGHVHSWGKYLSPSCWDEVIKDPFESWHKDWKSGFQNSEVSGSTAVDFGEYNYIQGVKIPVRMHGNRPCISCYALKSFAIKPGAAFQTYIGRGMGSRGQAARQGVYATVKASEIGMESLEDPSIPVLYLDKISLWETNLNQAAWNKIKEVESWPNRDEYEENRRSFSLDDLVADHEGRFDSEEEEDLPPDVVWALKNNQDLPEEKALEPTPTPQPQKEEFGIESIPVLIKMSDLLSDTLKKLQGCLDKIENLEKRVASLEAEKRAGFFVRHSPSKKQSNLRRHIHSFIFKAARAGKIPTVKDGYLQAYQMYEREKGISLHSLSQKQGIKKIEVIESREELSSLYEMCVRLFT